ncbi:MAG: GIY-YIG nuclease family protein [Bacteroides sp.]|nr:GIY-YIG nuclease family protein [Bacteroides sp.]
MVNIYEYWVYILSNNSRSVLYIGITNDLHRRFLEHKNGVTEGFTKKYRCHILLYYESFTDIKEAIAREKELKGWSREKKENLIRSINPRYWDMAHELKWI